MSKTSKLFGQRLKTARRWVNLSRKDLATVCNISVQMIHYYENGQREPSLTSLKNFARALNVSADWLIGIKQEATK